MVFELGGGALIKLYYREVIMVVLFALSCFFGLTYGSSDIGFEGLMYLLHSLWYQEDLLGSLSLHRTIFLDVRLPRLLLAALCGSSLAAAGVLCQGLFRNPLASPSVLGVASGSTFWVVLLIFSGGSLLNLPLVAFFGALVSAASVIGVSRLKPDLSMGSLLLSGLCLSSLWGASSSLLLSLSVAEFDKGLSILHWVLGGFSGRDFRHFFLGLLPWTLGFWGAFRLIRFLEVLNLGSETAFSLSIDVASLKKYTLLVISLLVSASVCVAGALPFVGLLVPHVTRQCLGHKQRKLLIFSAINGVSLTVCADLLARVVYSPFDLDAGVFTALLGTPFFLFLLFRSQTLDSL